MAQNCLVLIALCSAFFVLCTMAQDAVVVDPSITKSIVAEEVAAIKAVPITDPKVQTAVNWIVNTIESAGNGIGDHVWDVYNYLYNNTSPDALNADEIKQVENIIVSASSAADQKANVSVPVTDEDAE